MMQTMVGQILSKTPGGPRRMVKKVLGAAGYKIERIRPRRAGDSSPVSVVDLDDPSDLSYRVGDWRYAIPLDESVGRPCFGYSADSWHPYVAASREILDDEVTDYRDSILKRFFDTWQPVSVGDSHFPGISSIPDPLDRISAKSLFEPWLKRPVPCDDPLRMDCAPAGSPVFGPIATGAGELEFKRLQRMVTSIQKFGYDPDGFPRGLIRMVVLRHQGSLRYLIAHGQHRAAILSALGDDVIEVGIHTALPALIDTASADSWPHVRSGLLPAEVAVGFVTRYFQPNNDTHTSHIRQLVT